MSEKPANTPHRRMARRSSHTASIPNGRMRISPTAKLACKLAHRIITKTSFNEGARLSVRAFSSPASQMTNKGHARTAGRAGRAIAAQTSANAIIPNRAGP